MAHHALARFMLQKLLRERKVCSTGIEQTGGSGSTKVAPTLHRIATCEDSLSELKLARAAWSITEPAPRLDPPPTKSEESDIDQKLWSLAE